MLRLSFNSHRDNHGVFFFLEFFFLEKQKSPALSCEGKDTTSCSDTEAAQQRGKDDTRDVNTASCSSLTCFQSAL